VTVLRLPIFKQILNFFILLLISITELGVADVYDELDISGNIAFQLRGFTQNSMWLDQNTSDIESSVSGEWEIRWRSKSNDQRMSFIPFARWDENDKKRSHFDFREAYWAYQNKDVELLLGLNKVFWGVAESVHLIDIINQTDLVENINQEEKLGQPMIRLAFQEDYGLLSLYLLPYFRERSFPGSDGRFRGETVINADNAKYQSSSKRKHTDFAIRYSHYFGDVDLGLYYFNGTNRDPRLSMEGNNSELLLNYDQIEQIGLDLQYTYSSWLWKLESFIRDGYADSIFAGVAGFEYTFYQIFDGASDIGILFEYQYDDRSSAESMTTADNDFFFGSRWTSNNMNDGSILVGVVLDKKTSETFYSIEAKTRLKENFLLSLELKAITNSELGEPNFPQSRDDYLEIQISHFF
tara:strand:+ start:3492 stop:4721 length:1230 start_codon:yes stop_codon:yes gene_type:complete